VCGILGIIKERTFFGGNDEKENYRTVCGGDQSPTGAGHYCSDGGGFSIY
jgi:hypothetical protein